MIPTWDGLRPKNRSKTEPAMVWTGPYRAAGAAAVLILALVSAACSDSGTSLENAPEGHTVGKGGAAHAPGLSDPLANCTTCHGADLRGGPSGQPSCYTCHGQKW